MYQTVRSLLAEEVPPHKLWWMCLDHPLLMEVPLGSLAKFVLHSSKATPDEPAYLFLDELAYAKDWDLWLKTFYDEHWPLRLVGSSSSTAVLRDRRIESGVGRWEEQYLAPYLFKEFLELTDDPVDVPLGETLAETVELCIDAKMNIAKLPPLRKRFLLTGGFPEILIATRNGEVDEASLLLQSQRMLRSDAVERSIYKDIPQAFGLEKPFMLERILYTLAGQVTGILSPSGICQKLDGLAQPTFDRYLTFLERAFLVFTLENYSGSEASRQRRGRKIYFVDGAVRNAALQRGVAPLSDDHEMGLLFENMVASHLHALSRQSFVRVFHWRDKQDEVDLVYDHPEQPIAFEISSSASHRRAGLRRFLSQHPRFRNRCFVVAPSVPSVAPDISTEGIGSIALDLLLLAISAQSEKCLAARLGA